jgi:hypothetical protein
MNRKYAKIEIYPVIYEKNTNDEYVLDTNGDKIILKNWPEVSATDDYEVKTVITEYHKN